MTAVGATHDGFAAPSEAGGPRRAAVFARELAAEDRAWLLDALPRDERQALSVLLHELDALGLRPATSPERETVVPTVGPSPGRIERDLATWSRRRIAERLEGEPDDVVRIVLASVADPSVRQRVLQALAPARRGALARALPTNAAVGPRRALEAAWLRGMPDVTAPVVRGSLGRLAAAVRARWHAFADHGLPAGAAVVRAARQSIGLAPRERWRALRRRAGGSRP